MGLLACPSGFLDDIDIMWGGSRVMVIIGPDPLVSQFGMV
jgi:hypothetical protein